MLLAINKLRTGATVVPLAEGLGDVSGSMGARSKFCHGTQGALPGRHQSVQSHAEETPIQLRPVFRVERHWA